MARDHHMACVVRVDPGLPLPLQHAYNVAAHSQLQQSCYACADHQPV